MNKPKPVLNVSAFFFSKFLLGKIEKTENK